MGARVAHTAAGSCAARSTWWRWRVAAAQAVALRGPDGALPAVRALHDAVREEIPFWREDRYASPDLKRAARLVRSGRLLAAVEDVAGTLE